MQPLFTVQNLCTRLVKINHVISMYLSIFIHLYCNLFTPLCLTHGLKMSSDFKHSNPWIIYVFWVKMFFLVLTLIKVVIYHSIPSSDTSYRHTPKFLSLSGKFEVWVSCVQCSTLQHWCLFFLFNFCTPNCDRQEQFILSGFWKYRKEVIKLLSFSVGWYCLCTELNSFQAWVVKFRFQQ